MKRFGAFSRRRNPSTQELARLYTPILRGIDLARRITRGGNAQQLAFLVMLKGFQRLGRFPKPEEVPGAVVAHLRSRLGLEADAPADAPPRSRQRYLDAIREHLGGSRSGTKLAGSRRRRWPRPPSRWTTRRTS